MKNIHIGLVVILTIVPVVAGGCSAGDCEYPDVDRESKIPVGQVKITPETDVYPPILHSDEYEQPVPMPYPINTAGAEDSGFIMPDGNTFYIWFTPDPNIPAEKQVTDEVTGIYVSHKVGGVWQEPQRVWLKDPCELTLDGCVFVQDDTMWFASARTGYTGIHWFTANFVDGEWTDWENADFNPDYEVGELHISADGQELYFHSARPGGKGQYDIWVCRKEDGEWLPPQNVEAVNSPETDGWPYLTQDGNELWFTRTYQGSPAIFRSKRVDGEWQEPELISEVPLELIQGIVSGKKTLNPTIELAVKVPDGSTNNIVFAFVGVTDYSTSPHKHTRLLERDKWAQMILECRDSISKRLSDTVDGEDPLKVLKMRYAKGEITKEEYEQILHDIT